MERQNCGLRKFESLTGKGKLKVYEICRKATEVFSRKGYVNATLADVSRAAGISKGGIYHYFSTKEELLFVILLRYMDQTIEELKEKLKPSMSSREKLRIFIRHHIQHYRDNLHESRLILHEAQNLPADYWVIIRDKEREYLRILTSAVEKLILDFDRNPLRVKVIVYSLVGMCNWPYMWYDPQGPVSPEELAEEICNIFLGELSMEKSQS